MALTGAVEVAPLCYPSLAHNPRSLLGVKLCRRGSPSTLQLIDKLFCHSNAFSTYHKESKKIICSVHMRKKKVCSLTSRLLSSETSGASRNGEASRNTRGGSPGAGTRVWCVHITVFIYAYARYTHLVSATHFGNTQTQTHTHPHTHKSTYILQSV